VAVSYYKITKVLPGEFGKTGLSVDPTIHSLYLLSFVHIYMKLGWLVVASGSTELLLFQQHHLVLGFGAIACPTLLYLSILFLKIKESTKTGRKRKHD